MEDLDYLMKKIRHQDWRLKCLARHEFDQREIDSLKKSLSDIHRKFKDANEKIKANKDWKERNSASLEKSIKYYRQKYKENRQVLRQMIKEYIESE